MKKILILLLTLTLILCVLVACGRKTTNTTNDQTSSPPSAEASNNDTTGNDESNDTSNVMTSVNTEDILPDEDLVTTPPNLGTGDYTVVKIGDQWYIQCDNYEGNGGNMAEPYFNSIEEFINCLNTGLDPSYLDWMKKRFEITANGIKILDFNNLYYPDLPDGVKIITSENEPIEWLLSFSYSLIFAAEDNSFTGMFATIMSENEYNEIYDRERFNEYVLQDGEKHITVSRKERDNTAGYQYRYELFIEDTDYYAYVLFNSEELLTDEFILSFGAKPYEG